MYFEIADKEYNGYKYQQVNKKDLIDTIEAICRFENLRWFVLDMYDTTNIIETKLARQILWLYAGEGEQQCFSRCEITGQSFIARDFPNLSFYNCRFNNVDFSEADLSYCTFENCDFVDCDLSYVKAEGANFTGSDFCESTMRDARFDTCNFKGAKMNEVRGWPRLQFCCIEDADFGEDDEAVDLDDCRESETEWEAELDSSYLETQVL